jgi:integrase
MAAKPYTLKPRGKKGILWVRFTAPDGSEVYRSAGTTDRALATEWASKLHAEHYRVARLGEKPRRLWTEAVTAWLDDHQHKRSLSKDLHNLVWLDPHFRGKYLDEIDSDALKAVSDARRAEPKDKRRRKDGTAFTDQPTSQATVDKMLALIRSILRDAHGRGWLDLLPSVQLKAPPKEDYRWLTKDEAEALYDKLSDHLKPMYLFSLATGLREQNVLRLEWGKVDLSRRVMWVKAGAAKAKKAIGIPLNRDAIDVLKAQQGKHGRWVFPNEKGKPYDRANNHGFKAAQVRAGIAPLTWHDLRHTWASWHVMAGTSLRTLMELGGWRSIQSVLRYAHLSPEHLASDAARVEGFARNLPERS